MKGDKRKMNIDEMKNRISLALKDPTLQQGFEIICKNLTDLEKENAELKDDNKVMADNYSKMEQKFYDNLTKAKKIIREFMKYEINEYDGSLEIHFEKLKKQAEQFLKECK